MIFMDLANKLKELRKNLNLTQNELAKKLNVSRSTIAAWETSSQNISKKNIEKISTFFNENLSILSKDYTDIPTLYDRNPDILDNKTAKDMGYVSNKDVKFKYLTRLYLKNFRSFKNREIKLGRYFTLITGKNGTMKSSILGLIAHPFSNINNAKDLYGKPLKTSLRNVFKFSPITDKTSYLYYLEAVTKENKTIIEPIRIYFWNTRHRITVGKNNETGLGNFLLNTSYMNLKRLFPIVDTESKQISTNLTEKEHSWISDAYNKIMQREAFENFETISDDKNKYTCGPKDTYYDYNSISSGEDNLGSLLYKMLAFKRNKTADHKILQGIFCIDEIEASLHPSAQKSFLKFLYHWAKNNNIQVIATTHSLFLVEEFLKIQKEYSINDATLINISTQLVGKDCNYKIMTNPPYKQIYKELTFETIGTESLYKVNILCEDVLAKTVIKKIIKSPLILKNIDFITDITDEPGTSYKNFFSLIKNGVKLLSDSIIIVDPDVNDIEISKLQKKFTYLTKIPDKNNYPIEKRIAYYIHDDLDGSEENIFKEREKSARLSDMYEHNISFNKNDKNINPFKIWAKDKKNNGFFLKCLELYLKKNSVYFNEFRENVINLINQRRVENGLPALPKDI